MIKDNKDWLSVYLYYAEPWERFLTDALAPFIEARLQEDAMEQYFFIRYWEKGPHIRLRIKGEKDYLEQVLYPALLMHFTKYFSEFPSQRQELPAQTPELQWYPNNSIHRIDYEPEIERYGGTKAIEIAERQFQLSSDTVLSALAEGSWSYDRALGVGIQLHLAFAKAMGMELIEIKEFFTYIFQGWLPLAHPQLQTKDVPQEIIEFMMKAFDENFKKQREALVSYISAVWEGLEENADFEQDWMNRWIAEHRVLLEKINDLKTLNEINFPSSRIYEQENTFFATPLEKRALWSIYSSYVHMTNNRLGIMNRDEGYLGYLIMRSFEEMGLID